MVRHWISLVLANLPALQPQFDRQIRQFSLEIVPDIFERFAKAVQTAPEVLECHKVASDFD